LHQFSCWFSHFALLFIYLFNTPDGSIANS